MVIFEKQDSYFTPLTISIGCYVCSECIAMCGSLTSSSKLKIPFIKL